MLMRDLRYDSRQRFENRKFYTSDDALLREKPKVYAPRVM